MSLENHVGHNLELDDSFDLKLGFELFAVEWRHCEVIVLPVGAAEVHLLVTVTSLNHRAHPIDDDHVLRARLLLR